MSKSAIIQARIDPELKEKAQKIFDTLNISMSAAISIYLTQVTLHRGIPFEIRIPNEITLTTMKETEERKSLHSVDTVDTVDELFKDLVK